MSMSGKTAPSIFVLVFVAALLSSCGSSTKTRIASSWVDEQIAPRTFSKILVVGVAKRKDPRQLFEETLKKEIQERGVTVVGSLEVMPVEERISREAFDKYFKDLGFDGVLLTSVRSVDEREKELRPSSTQAFMGQQGNQSFYQAYYSTYQQVYYPPEVISQQVVVVETKLFETQDGNPVWTCVSETIDPDGVKDAIASLTDAIVEELANQRFFSR